MGSIRERWEVCLDQIRDMKEENNKLKEENDRINKLIDEILTENRYYKKRYYYELDMNRKSKELGRGGILYGKDGKES